MLGSDPIRQYEASCSSNGQDVITLEPISPKGGKDPRWVDWFFDAIFKEPCLSFGYAQAGQENSFGWEYMESGSIYQHKRLEELRDAGLISVETLSASGEWFKSEYKSTPPSAVVASRDMDREDSGALWHCSSRYRASLSWEGSSLRLRDVQLFDERREEPFLNSVCESSACKYDALPVMDGFLWSSEAFRAGLYLRDANGSIALQKPPSVSERGAKALRVEAGAFVFDFEEKALRLSGPTEGSWSLDALWDAKAKSSFRGVEMEKLLFEHEGWSYSVSIAKGSAQAIENGYALRPDASGVLELAF